MSLKRCEKGHFYDPDKYRQCPYCNPEKSDSNEADRENEERDVLMGVIAPRKEELVFLRKRIKEYERKITDDPGDTVIPLANYTVGWLMAIDGPHKGQDYSLRAGRNTIGRNVSMDVPLLFDTAAAREKHAIVIFDPVSQMTLCQAGESRELFYLNGKVVTDTVELRKGDVLTIGRTKLMFVPFCGELHTWEEK